MRSIEKMFRLKIMRTPDKPSIVTLSVKFRDLKFALLQADYQKISYVLAWVEYKIFMRVD
jgi:hypothetical protein